MFSIKDLTEDTPTEPVTADELAAHLRLNTHDEDSLLESFISTARQQFEHLTQRSVTAHTYRQYVQAFAQLNQPAVYDAIHQWEMVRGGTAIWLMRGDVTTIDGVHYIDGNNVTQADTSYASDLILSPARVWWVNPPSVSSTSPWVAYVDFTAGMVTVPSDVKVSILLLAAHYYEQRAAYIVDDLKELPFGFCTIAAKYSLGLSGPWGQ